MAKWYCVTDYTNIIPNKPGCYAIYIYNLETNKKELLYIGTSNNLYQRLYKHPVIRTLRALLSAPEVVYIKCREIKNTKKRNLLEKQLISRIKPKVNYAIYPH